MMRTMRTMVKTMMIAIIMIITIAFTMNVRVEAKTKVLRDGRMTIIQGQFGTKIKWDNKVIRWYDYYGKIRIIPDEKLTYKMLTHRKNKVLYVAKITGKVVNNKLDGKTSNGEYISYKCLKGKTHKGDKILTYCVYNPYTHWFDDIDERYDVIIKRQ